jgi:peptidoglycan/xylan/chitin deacetylase (PgdA/CDA1 family)
MSDTLVLCYHAVSTAWDHPMAVAPSRLEQHVRSLLARGYRFRTFTASVVDPQPGRTAVLTFDDGFRGVFTQGLPLLRRLGVPATLFVPTDHVGTERPLSWPGFQDLLGRPAAPDLLAMGWDEVRELAAAGWEVGSHSCTHPRLPELPDEAVDRELVRSREACEAELDRPCTSLAYPFGDVDDRVARRAAAAGYVAGTTLQRAVAPTGPLRVPRICVTRVDRRLRFATKVAPTLRTPAASAAVDLVHAARRRARGGRPDSPVLQGTS